MEVRTAADIEKALAELGTAERAEQSKRYLKSELRHLGARVPLELWAEPVFERRDCAAFLLEYRVDLLGPRDLPAIKRLVAGSDTWALVDQLSAGVLGYLLLAHPDAAARLDPWPVTGWVLREVGKKRPALVYEWLLPRTDRASGVAIREAVKYLEPDQREAILARGGRGSSRRAIS